MSYSLSPMGTVTTVIWARLPSHPEPGLLSSADGPLRALGSGAAQMLPWTAEILGKMRTAGGAQNRGGVRLKLAIRWPTECPGKASSLVT